MRGRPKLSDSRNNQYRVRLNDEENRKLNYSSSVTGKPKSEIFRLALIDYYNKVLLNEVNDGMPDEEIWEIEGISLKRVIQCPYCCCSIRIDLEEECSISTDERQMGLESLYEFDYMETCSSCGHRFKVVGYISEYPAGALNHEDIRTAMIQEEDK